MQKFGRLAGILVLLVAFAACADDDVVGAGEPPIRLSGTMKLAADSITVTLRLANLSDTTQVVEWEECPTYSPANFVLFRDAQYSQQAWAQRVSLSCDMEDGQMALAKSASGSIRGFPVGVADILDDVAPGRYYVAIRPLALTVRRVGTSYAAPVEATVPVGALDLAAPAPATP